VKRKKRSLSDKKKTIHLPRRHGASWSYALEQRIDDAIRASRASRKERK
jgi:hypothetical protein